MKNRQNGQLKSVFGRAGEPVVSGSARKAAWDAVDHTDHGMPQEFFDQYARDIDPIKTAKGEVPVGDPERIRREAKLAGALLGHAYFYGHNGLTAHPSQHQEVKITGAEQVGLQNAPVEQVSTNK